MRGPCAVLILIALACRGHDSAESRGPARVDSSRLQVTAPPDSPVTDSLQPAHVLGVLYERLTAIGEGRAAVRSRLGEPLLTTTAAETNAHAATATDTLIQWNFDHLHFKFLVAAGTELLVETRAAANYPAVASLIGHFSTLEAAEATLGAPSWTVVLGDTMVWGYNLPEPDIGASQNAVNLYFKNDHLIFVAAVPYVD
jgi:hypothetical protein